MSEPVFYTRLPDHEPHRSVRVEIAQFHVSLEEWHRGSRLLTRIELSREQLLAFLVALPENYLQAALRVKTTGDPEPFMPLEDKPAEEDPA